MSDEIGRWYEAKAEEARRLREEVAAAERFLRMCIAIDPTATYAAQHRKLRGLRAKLEMAEDTGD